MDSPQHQEEDVDAEPPAGGQARRGPRLRPPPPVYTVDADLSVALSRPLVPALLGELAKHLQYSRGQCHAPVDRLAAACTAAASEQQASKRRRTAAGLRRIGRYLNQLGGLLDALHDIPLRPLLCGGACAALLLGASPLRPREVYLVRFAADGGCGGGSGGCSCGGEGPAAAEAAEQLPPERVREISTAGKRLLRALIVEGAAFDEWADVCVPTKMFLMVQAPAGSPPPQGFLPRRGFSINLRKGFQVNINAQLAAGDLGGCDQRRHPSHHSQQHHHPHSQQHHHPQHPQQQQQQSLEEQLETSMQICDTDSGSGLEDDWGPDEAAQGPSGLQQQQQQQQQHQQGEEGEAGEGLGGARDPQELIWFQCAVAVKGMRPLEQAG